MNLKINKIVIHKFLIPLKMPFRISSGEITSKEGVIIEMHSNGLIGWGEASVDAVPFYAHETTGSVIDLINRALAPLILNKTFNHPQELVDLMDHFRGGAFAKAALEAAFWDIYGKALDKPVSELIGGTRTTVESGPSLGIKKTPQLLVEAVGKVLEEKWRRIKIKVAPNFDSEYIKAVREAYPDIQLMVDANNAYSKKDFELIKSWDKYNLLMIEQPLAEEDIYFHSQLKTLITTPICLDESIHTINDMNSCAELKSADIVNIKVCRVGGLCNAKKIHDICQANNIPNWIGSRVGSGVAEAARLVAASLPNCSYASDCVISHMYMSDDLVVHDYVQPNPWSFEVKKCAGMGITIDLDKLAKYSIETLSLI